MSWNTGEKLINLPGGKTYRPTTDDLKAEIIKAAKSVGLNEFNVRLNGTYIEKPENLPTNSIAALTVAVTVESLEISPRNTAG